MKATLQPLLFDETSAGGVKTPSLGVDSHVAGLEDGVYAMDLNTMHREELLRLAMIGRYLTTYAEELLFERDGGLKL